VVALESGFNYRGQRYRSLSEPARLITGNRLVRAIVGVDPIS
jgi:hypothetical protein